MPRITVLIQHARKALFSAGFLLLGMNLSAGFLHYLYQILAGKHLTTEAFGSLNIQLTYFNLAMSLGILSQNFAVLTPSARNLVRPVLYFGLLAGAFGLGVLWIPSPIGMQILGTVLAGLVFYFLLGVLQKEGRLFWFGFIPFVGGLLKLSSVFWAAHFHADEGMAEALFEGALLPISLLTLLWALVGAVFYRQKLKNQTVQLEKSPHSTQIAPDLFRALLVGVAFVAFPTLDLLILPRLFDLEVTGVFSRIQLFSKILFFGPVTLLQISFPVYVRDFQGLATRAELAKIRRLEILGLSCCALVAGLFAWLGPWFSARFLYPTPLSGLEIGLACFSILGLYGILMAIQILCATRRTLATLGLYLAMGLVVFLVFLFKPADLKTYLLFTCVAWAVLSGVVAWLIRSKTRA